MRDSVDAAHVQGVQLDNDLRRHPCDQNLEPLDTSVSTVLICRSGSTHPNFQVGGGQAFRTLCPSAKRRPDTEVSIKPHCVTIRIFKALICSAVGSCFFSSLGLHPSFPDTQQMFHRPHFGQACQFQRHLICHEWVTL